MKKALSITIIALCMTLLVTELVLVDIWIQDFFSSRKRPRGYGLNRSQWLA